MSQWPTTGINALSTNIDTTYADDPARPDIKQLQQDTDVVHSALQAVPDWCVRGVIVTTGTEARPTGAAPVLWVGGTALPANATAQDVWIAGANATVTPPDVTAPTAPTGVTAVANSSSSVTVSWTAATDDRAVTGYLVYRNGAQVGATTGAVTYTDTMAPSGTSGLVYSVKAQDAAGNLSAAGTAAAVTTPAPPSAVDYSVYGTNAPLGTVTKSTDGPVTVANLFYFASSATGAWQITGGRIYVPAGVTMPATAAVSLWVGDEASTAALSATPTATVTMTGITTGGWTGVHFPAAVPIAVGAPFYLGYKFADGSYLSSDPGQDAPITYNAVGLYEGGSLEPSTFGSRALYRYDSGASGHTSNNRTLWSCDVLVAAR